MVLFFTFLNVCSNWSLLCSLCTGWGGQACTRSEHAQPAPSLPCGRMMEWQSPVSREGCHSGTVPLKKDSRQVGVVS